MSKGKEKMAPPAYDPYVNKTVKVDMETGEIIERKKYYTTIRTYDSTKQKPSRSGGISKTIPGDTYTIRELLQRHSVGLSLSDERVPMYHGDEQVVMDVSEFRKLPYTDRKAMIDAAKAKVDEIRLKMKVDADKQIQDRLDKQFEAKFEAELERRNKEKQNRNSDSDKKE